MFLVMPKSSTPPKKDARMELKLPQETMDALIDIHKNHKISPQDIARALLEDAARFYRDHGYFGFPLKIIPDEEFIKKVRVSVLESSDAGLPAVAGTDAEYEAIRKSRTVPKPKKTGTNG